MSQPDPDTDQTNLHGHQSEESQSGKPDSAKRKLIVDYISMVGFNGLVALLSFLTTSMLLALLGRDSYGEIVSLTSTTLMFTIFSTDWTAQSITRYGTEEFLDQGRIGRIFWNRLFIAMASTFLLLSTFPVWGYFLRNFASIPTHGLIFISIYMPFQVYWNHMQRVMPVIKRHNMLYPLLTLERVVILVLIFILYLTGHLSVTTVLPGYVLGSLTAGLVATWVAVSEIGKPELPEFNTCKKIVSFSFPLIPALWVGLLSTNSLDYLMIRRYVGTAQLGVYALGVQIAGIIQQVVQIAGVLAGPRVVSMRLKNETQNLQNFIQKQVTPGLAVWTLACLIGALVVAFPLKGQLPPNYRLLSDLAWPLAVVSAIVPVWFIVWNPLLVAYEQVNIVMWSSMISGLVNLAANLILIPSLGVIGSAWASVLAFTTTSFTAEALISHQKPSYFPARGWALYAPMVVLGVLSAVVQLILK